MNRSAKVISLLLLPAFLAFTLSSCRDSPFEQEHDRAEARNPRWLEIKLDTADHRREYRENEPIHFIITYASSVPYQYKVQASSDNEVSFSDVLHISLGQTIRSNRAIICCFSQIVGLTDEPLKLELPHVTELKHGYYELWVSTRRVFQWNVANETYGPSDNVCASNLLRVKVLPVNK